MLYDGDNLENVEVKSKVIFSFSLFFLYLGATRALLGRYSGATRALFGRYTGAWMIYAGAAVGCCCLEVHGRCIRALVNRFGR